MQSAYSLGYRRMIVDPVYTDVDLIVEYASDVLFISGAYGSSVDDVFMSAVRFAGMEKELAVLDRLIAVLGVTRLRTPRLERDFADLYVHNGRQPPEGTLDRLSDVLAMLTNHRVLRAEEELSALLDAGQVKGAAVKKALPRIKWVADALSARTAKIT